MTDSTGDQGVIAVLLERFEKQRLPKALRLKKRVDAGERLSESDIEFLEDVFDTMKQAQPLVERNPEYKKLVASAIDLYKEITERALQNEQGS